MTRLLLVEAIEGTGAEVETRYPPLGLAYLASYARSRCDVDVKIVTVAASDITAALERNHPDIVGITAVTQSFDEALETARLVKSWRPIPVVVGGHHITAIPESLGPHMDVAVLGEGEETLAELLDVYRKDGLAGDALRNVAGIAFRERGELVITRPRPMIGNLDELPMPARDLLELEPDDIHILTSRGCPYRCAFCSSSHFWKGVRYHSAERVVAEISEVVGLYSTRHINVYDDLFVVNKKRLARITALLEEKDFMREKRVEFSCLARADAADEELVSLLKRINVVDVALGLESGSDRVLKMLKGPSASVSRNRESVRLFRDAGIRVVGSFIIGSPTETYEDAVATLGLIRELSLDGGEAYLAVPYPGTKLWEYALSHGLFEPSMGWGRLRLNPREDPIVLTDQIPAKDVLELLRQAGEVVGPDEAVVIHGLKEVVRVLRSTVERKDKAIGRIRRQRRGLLRLLVTALATIIVYALFFS